MGEEDMERKPLGIVANTLFLIVSAVLLIIGVVTNTSNPDWMSSMIPGLEIFAGGLGVLLSVILFLLAYYIWQGNEVAWWALIIVMGLGTAINAYALLTNTLTSVFTFIAQIILVALLLHKDTIAYCKPDISWRGWSLEG